MATYKVTINERTKEGRELISLLMKNKLITFKESKTVEKKRSLSDVPVMTKAELKKRIAQAHRNQKAGKCTVVKPGELHKFLESL